MPEWRQYLVVRLAPLGLPPLREAEIVEELTAHLDDRYRELTAGGESADVARRLALADLDAAGVLTDRLRDVERPAPADPIVPGVPQTRRGDLMQTFLQDLMYGARTLRRQPGFTVAAIAMLAVGIGANTAIFSVVNGLLLRPLPVSRPHELVGIYTSDFSGPRFGTSSYPDYVDFRDATHTCRGLVAATILAVSLDTGGTADRLFAEAVSANYFEVLGVKPAIGRPFAADADRTASSSEVVLGYGLWQRRFAADPHVVGTTITLSGHGFTVVGIAPRDYPGLERGLSMDAWIPLAALPTINPTSGSLTSRGNRSLVLMGRLAPGATVASAQAEFSGLGAALHASYPDNWTDVRRSPRAVTVLPEDQARFFPSGRGAVLGFMSVLMAVVGLVLIIACANVANLLLARAAGRVREIATRLALGASRGRLVRQLLTESLLLATIGGGAGLLLAVWGIGMLMSFQPPVPFPIKLDLGLDTRVLLVTLCLTLVTAVFCGLAPALAASRADVAPALKDGALAAGGGRTTRLRQLLVVTQVTVSLVLLVAAGLFVRSLQHATAIDPGFNPANVIMASVDLEAQGYTEARGDRFYHDLLERTRELPGVRTATWASIVPLGLGFGRRNIAVDGYHPREGEEMEFGASSVGPRYFETMGIRLVHGRDFTDRDADGAPRVAIVNETFARRFWSNANPIGRRIARGIAADPARTEWYEVVGVAADGKYATLGEAPREFFYMPLFQVHEAGATLLIRTETGSTTLFAALRAAVADLDRALPLIDAKTMSDHLSLSLLPARIAGSVLGTMGGVGLLLAALGLYGVMAYGVARRTRELGIRLSLGASRTDVFRLVLRQGLTLTGVGCLVGLAIAFAATQALASQLYGISPSDPITFVSVVVVLASAASAACVVPAYRAMRVDPLVALRQE